MPLRSNDAEQKYRCSEYKQEITDSVFDMNGDTLLRASSRGSKLWKGSPQQASGIGGKLPISADESHCLNVSLGDEHSIKWICMMLRQTCHMESMLKIYREHLHIVSSSPSGNVLIQWLVEPELRIRSADLDRHFPHRGNAEEECVFRITKRSLSCGAKTWVSVDQPKERVCVSSSSFMSCTLPSHPVAHQSRPTCAERCLFQVQAVDASLAAQIHHGVWQQLYDAQ